MKTKFTKAFICLAAIAVIMALAVLAGPATASLASEPEEKIEVVILQPYMPYAFTPDGYYMGTDELIPFSGGTYVLTGSPNVDITFCANEGETATYNVIFHELNAVAMEWNGIFGIDNGVTLNATVIGENSLVGYNYPGILLNEQNTEMPAPTVNFTVSENSSILIGYEVYADQCIDEGVNVTIDKNATSSVDISDEGWRYNQSVVFSNGTPKKHSVSVTSGGTTTCTDYAVCEYCGIEYGEAPIGHTFDNDCDSECNGCDLIREVGDHLYDNDCDASCNICFSEREISHTYDNACDGVCNVCEAQRTVSHTYDNECDEICDVCEEKRTVSHTYDNACDGVCNVCEAQRTVSHTYGNECDEICDVCEEKRTVSHTYDNACDGMCNVCESAREVKHAYENGSCTVCKAADPNYTLEADEPKTGKVILIVLACLLVAGGAVFVLRYARKLKVEN